MLYHIIYIHIYLGYSPARVTLYKQTAFACVAELPLNARISQLAIPFFQCFSVGKLAGCLYVPRI